LNEEKIFRRTAAGLDEILRDTHELSQSERLILAVIDGVIPCSVVRRKLNGLPDDRFDRALHSLLEKGLMMEADESVQQVSTDSGAANLSLRVDSGGLRSAVLEEGHGYAAINTVQMRRPRIAKVDVYLPLEPKLKRDSDASISGTQRPSGASLESLSPLQSGMDEDDQQFGTSTRWIHWAILVGILLIVAMLIWQNIG
jgi:hypothetical protein